VNIVVFATLLSIESNAAWGQYRQKNHDYDEEGYLETLYKYRSTNKQIVVLNG
jgi:hypothetical protein